MKISNIITQILTNTTIKPQSDKPIAVVLNIVFKNGAIQYIEDQFEPAELVLYPNPAEDIIYIKGISVFDLSEVSVINVNGHTVLTCNEISTTNGIDISELKNGIYFARIKSGNKVHSKKIVIQH